MAFPASQAYFRFFDLPSELRIKIYEYALVVPDRPVDLDPLNYRRITPRLQCLLVSQRMHAEASRIFYGANVFRLFPMHGRFFNTKKPLLVRLAPRYRSIITAFELRLGPGWGKPPRSQRMTDALGLEHCTVLKVLKIFVEVDPSQAVFNGFRGCDNSEDSYTRFCIALVSDVLDRTPSVVAVELDAYPSVGKDSPLIVALVDLIKSASKVVIWGPLRGWNNDADPGELGLEAALAGMSL